MTKTLFLCVLTISLANCQNHKQPAQYVGNIDLIVPRGMTIATRFLPPSGYQRIEMPDTSFGGYLQRQPLKPHETPVLHYDGSKKSNQNVHAAVLDVDTGERNLQQCADAIMRLRAEYLWSQARFDEIHFNFTNGFRVNYTKWRQGYRIKVFGNKSEWVSTSAADSSYRVFRDYLDLIFRYAGTASLEKEMTAVPLSDLQIGDVFIHGGHPGHAVIVVDIARHATSGEKVFLLAQSYMPAQDIHVLKNPNSAALSPWYSTNFGEVLKTMEWDFSKQEVRRF